MSWLIEIALGVCLIILAGGLVNAINTYVTNRSKLKKREMENPQSKGEKDDLQARLDEIERRLTDVQDVMIALSEKFDRWEREKEKL